MGGVRNTQFNRERRKVFPDDVYGSESDKKPRSQLAHEVRGVEDMKNLQNAEAYKDIDGEDSRYVEPADFKDASSHFSHRKEKGDGQKQNGKSAGVYAVCFSVFYGLTDEFHQGFTPGREPKIRDVGFDTIGAGFAIYFIWKLLPRVPKRLGDLAENFQLQ